MMGSRAVARVAGACSLTCSAFDCGSSTQSSREECVRSRAKRPPPIIHAVDHDGNTVRTFRPVPRSVSANAPPELPKKSQQECAESANREQADLLGIRIALATQYTRVAARNAAQRKHAEDATLPAHAPDRGPPETQQRSMT